ncbi:F-box/FBD/LRR-repeat protein At1g13570-like [Vicia villosa]|uniref:F-box/FBD/LRR-repeat protein At1g13570-like n=1 Tax=Vicia villosa TaxID=3911 RepID=UPI00273CADC4|nr:F-box/FBD/LRR-repeat protein At1g13570-like [Vicia villosa]XP_058724942.1 F-box/FBD/LRR-repeat protein At1g13570-like [Vicia villosa]XP_058724943.1 F-box/FBD/LRR-repeat protein At1g13570-like [Vicia villosa]
MGRKHKKSTRPRQTVIDTVVTDRISCLPGHVIDQILSYLPIREAVRTSVLSKIWKNKWYTLPNLVFDKQGVALEGSLVNKSKLVRIVDHVLLLHSGPINMFKFSQYDIIDEFFFTDIDRWILHLIGRCVKELVLEIIDQEEEYYKIPWCLFSCQSLHHLKLQCCWLNPLGVFEGFRNLKSLDLSFVTMAQDAFENMISGCPLLEKLKLAEVDGLTQINIHALNLKIFEVFGEFEGINFDNTFQLVTVIMNLRLNLSPENNQSTLHGRSSNLLDFFNRRPHLQSLVIGSCFLKYLAAGLLPRKLPTPCIGLTYLSLSINFDDLKEISAALCLLKSSPNLKKLEISARIEHHTVPLTPVSVYDWDDTFSKPATPIPVRHVTIHRISGFQPELDFIRFLLLYSLVLEKLIVKPIVNVRPELVPELIRFKRASGDAEVIYQVEDS